MMKLKDVDPGVKRLFPWLLFLVLALGFSLGAIELARGEEAPPVTFCDKIKLYLQSHSEAEARVAAAEKHFPKWLIRKAERCVR